MQMPDCGPCELVRGKLVKREYNPFQTALVATKVLRRLAEYVDEHGAGMVLPASGFQIAHDPDTVLAPDAAFISAERVPNDRIEGYFDGAPDLAVEVLSPTDRAGEVLAKVLDWLDAGCRAVWVVDPETRTVTVYHSRKEIVVLGQTDELGGGEVVPGFAVSVAEIFAA